MNGSQQHIASFESIYLVDDAAVAALSQEDQAHIISEQGRPLVALNLTVRPAVAQGLTHELTYLMPWFVLASIVGQAQEARRIMPEARRHDFDRTVAAVEQAAKGQLEQFRQ